MVTAALLRPEAVVAARHRIDYGTDYSREVRAAAVLGRPARPLPRGRSSRLRRPVVDMAAAAAVVAEEWTTRTGLHLVECTMEVVVAMVEAVVTIGHTHLQTRRGHRASKIIRAEVAGAAVVLVVDFLRDQELVGCRAALACDDCVSRRKTIYFIVLLDLILRGTSIAHVIRNDVLSPLYVTHVQIFPGFWV